MLRALVLVKGPPLTVRVPLLGTYEVFLRRSERKPGTLSWRLFLYWPRGEAFAAVD